MSNCNNVKRGSEFASTLRVPDDVILTANECNYENRKMSSALPKVDHEQNDNVVCQNIQAGNTIRLTLDNDESNAYYNDEPRETPNTTKKTSNREFDKNLNSEYWNNSNATHNVKSLASINSNMNQENTESDASAIGSQVTVGAIGTKQDQATGSAGNVGHGKRYWKYRAAVHAITAAGYMGKGCKKNTRFKNRREALAFFRRQARVVMMVMRWMAILAEHQKTSLKQELKTFVDIAKEVEEYTVFKPYAGSELSFDKNYFKVNREISLSSEVKRILSLKCDARTDENITQVMLGLQSLKALAEYPLRTQVKLCKAAWLQTVTPNTVIVRQGHVSFGFYFILSGTAYVKKSYYNEKTNMRSMNTASRLTKGQSFGEMGLICNQKRSATVESSTAMDLLVIGQTDFVNIFLNGNDVTKDSEHVRFLRGIPVLLHWPVDMVKTSPSQCIMHYYKRGSVITKNGTTSDWIYIVKSGTCEAIKQLKRAKPKSKMSRRPSIFYCDTMLHQPHNEPRVDTGTRRPSLPSNISGGFDTRGRKCSIMGFMPSISKKHTITPESDQDTSIDVTCTDLYPNTTPHKLADSPSFRIPRSYSYSAVERSRIRTSRPTPIRDATNYHDINIGRELKERSKSVSFCVDRQSAQQPNSRDDTAYPNSETHRRECFAEEEHVFVHVQLLQSGDIFGLNTVRFGDDVLEEGASVCLVSRGAEVIMLSKRTFLIGSNEQVRKTVRETIRPYPKDEDLQDNLQTKVDWECYKKTLVHDMTIHRRESRILNTCFS